MSLRLQCLPAQVPASLPSAVKKHRVSLYLPSRYRLKNLEWRSLASFSRARIFAAQALDQDLPEPGTNPDMGLQNLARRRAVFVCLPFHLICVTH